MKTGDKSKDPIPRPGEHCPRCQVEGVRGQCKQGPNQAGEALFTSAED